VTQEEIVAFLSDRFAEMDALFTYVVDSARNSENYEDFRRKLDQGLGEVKITQAVEVEKWLDEQEGYVIVVKDPYDKTDYLREDTGLPMLFKTPEDAYRAVPQRHELTKIINLNETRQAQ
jgi:hypothetical protein